MSELLCLLNAVIGALCMSACIKKKKKSLSRVCTRDRALSDLKKKKKGARLNLLYSVTFACGGITCSHANTPYGTVGPRS